MQGQAMIAGDVVNTASRLQSAAPVGAVLVGEETYGATRGSIEYRPGAAADAEGQAGAGARVGGAPRDRRGRRAAGHRRAADRAGARARPADRRVGPRRRRGADAVHHGVRPVGDRQVAALARAVAARRGAGRRASSAAARRRTAPARRTARSSSRSSRSLGSSTATSPRPRARSWQRPSPTSPARPPPRSTPPTSRPCSGLEGEAAVARPRDALLLGPRARRVARAARADAAPLRGHPLGRRQPARPARDLRRQGARGARAVRRARPARAPHRAGRAGAAACPRTPPCCSTRSARPRASSSPASCSPRPRSRGTVPRRSRRPRRATRCSSRSSRPRSRSGRRATQPRLPSSVQAIVAARLDALPPDERRVLVDASVVGRVFWRGALAEMDYM